MEIVVRDGFIFHREMERGDLEVKCGVLLLISAQTAADTNSKIATSYL